MKRGFSLSEVLIVLGVIGVVASLTLPSVIKNYQQQQTISKLKKVYTNLNQAIKLSQADNDEYKYWDLSSLSAKKEFDKYWKPYIKTVKYCVSYSDCGYSSKTGWMQPNGSTYNSYYSSGAFILPDGVLVKLADDLIIVDLNAEKKPNKLSKDVFLFNITPQGYIRAHGSSSSYNTIKTYCNSTHGHTCAARIMYNNWKIDKDYPW